MKPEPNLLEDRAKVRRLRDASIAELRICRMAAGLQATIISFIVGSAATMAYANAPAITVFVTLFVLGYATWALVVICRAGVVLRMTIVAAGFFLDGRFTEAAGLFGSVTEERR